MVQPKEGKKKYSASFLFLFFLFHAGPGTASDHQDRLPCPDHTEDRWQPRDGRSPEPRPHCPHHPHPDSRPASSGKSCAPSFLGVLGLRDVNKASRPWIDAETLWNVSVKLQNHPFLVFFFLLEKYQHLVLCGSPRVYEEQGRDRRGAAGPHRTICLLGPANGGLASEEA